MSWKYNLFKESFKEDLEMWKEQEFDIEPVDYANDFFYMEQNWNNADITSGQYCYSEEEITEFLGTYKDEQENEYQEKDGA
jgi:hypothetical protein